LQDGSDGSKIFLEGVNEYCCIISIHGSSPSSYRNRKVGEDMSQNLLNYNSPHVPVIVIMTSDSYTYVPHNLKGLLSSEQDPITGVLQYYNSLFKITSE
jgi:hypothetical protein